MPKPRQLLTQRERLAGEELQQLVVVAEVPPVATVGVEQAVVRSCRTTHRLGEPGSTALANVDSTDLAAAVLVIYTVSRKAAVRRTLPQPRCVGRLVRADARLTSFAVRVTQALFADKFGASHGGSTYDERLALLGPGAPNESGRGAFDGSSLRVNEPERFAIWWHRWIGIRTRLLRALRAQGLGPTGVVAGASEWRAAGRCPGTCGGEGHDGRVPGRRPARYRVPRCRPRRQGSTRLGVGRTDARSRRAARRICHSGAAPESEYRNTEYPAVVRHPQSLPRSFRLKPQHPETGVSRK